MAHRSVSRKALANATNPQDGMTAKQKKTAAVAAALLAGLLQQANSYTYARVLHDLARATGNVKPITLDALVAQKLADRSQVSADSIINTQIKKMASLLTTYDTQDEAMSAFQDWLGPHLDAITRYESGLATNAAQNDFVSQNSLAGTEHVEPYDGECDICVEAIAMGEVSIGDLPDMPAHFNCSHFIVQNYVNLPDNPNDLWIGSDNGEQL